MCNKSFMETIQLPNQFDSPNIGKTEMIYLHGFQNPQQSDSFADSFFLLLLLFLLSFIFFGITTPRSHHIPDIFFVFICLTCIKYGTFTPLESTDYSNFLILFEQKEGNFFLHFLLFYIWLLNSRKWNESVVILSNRTVEPKKIEKEHQVRK